jgi:predicted enzyme related to lactoylglutathione lyase
MLKRIEVGIDCRDPKAQAAFWSVALGYGIGDLDPAGIYLDLTPPSESMPVIYFQVVEEGKFSKNRLHLDLWEDDPDRVIDELVALGAHRLGDPQSGSAGGWWQVMSDPEGNEFCVCRA